MTTALLDANILYSSPIRDILIQLAIQGLARIRWTDAIHDEWMSALMRNRPDLQRHQLERTRRMMDAHVADALITNYEKQVENYSLPDLHDRHVLAAAVAGNCKVIVTKNTKDFPQETLARLGIEAVDPDDYLLRLLRQYPVDFCAELRRIRRRWKYPALSVDEYLANLKRSGLALTTAELTRHRQLLE